MPTEYVRLCLTACRGKVPSLPKVLHFQQRRYPRCRRCPSKVLFCDVTNPSGAAAAAAVNFFVVVGDNVDDDNGK